VPPEYPGGLLAQRLPPTRVKVRLIVDEGGSVQHATLLDDGHQNDPAFFAAVQSAVNAWAFTPLIRRKPVRDVTTTLTYHGLTRQFAGVATALPFHQDYEFTFTQRDGIGFVTTQAPK
jgi:TonB family protein